MPETVNQVWEEGLRRAFLKGFSMAQGALLTSMLGDLQQNGSIFDCKMPLPPGMSILDFASKVGTTLQLHANFDPEREPTTIARSIIASLTKEQAPLFEAAKSNKKNTSDEGTLPKGKRAADGDEATPAPAAKKARKTKTSVGDGQVSAAATASKNTPKITKKNTQPKSKAATGHVNPTTNAFGNINNMAQNSAPYAPKRKTISDEADTHPAKRTTLPQPSAQADNGMSQMLTPPESGFIQQTQVSNVNHQAAMAANTGNIFYSNNGLAFPIPQLNLDEPIPMTQPIVGQSASAATLPQIGLQNGTTSTSPQDVTDVEA